jgi:hypothetical protein
VTAKAHDVSTLTPLLAASAVADEPAGPDAVPEVGAGVALAPGGRSVREVAVGERVAPEIARDDVRRVVVIDTVFREFDEGA